MGYMHIENLYKPQAQDILLFKECYAMEKIHGTSAHGLINRDKVSYFSGGVSQSAFEGAVKGKVEKNLANADLPIDLPICIYGEAYGGSCQKMSNVYGKELKFVVFDVKIGDTWLSVPNAEDVATKLGFEFVHDNKIPATIEDINKERDLPSVQSARNGVHNKEWKEGIVLRPLNEFIKSNGKRLIVKHKRDEARETKTVREVSPEKLKVLSDAKAIADEWVTEMRLIHVLDKIDSNPDMSIMPKLIPAMIEDVRREAEGEIEWSAVVAKAITAKTATVLKNYLESSLTSK